MLRLLIILSLVWPPLTLHAIASSSGPTPECHSTSCCEIIEITTCCGERIVEHACGITGDECICGVQPGNSEPAPKVPMPRPGNEIAPALSNTTAIIFDLLPETPLASMRSADPDIARTHNRKQALLGIWRT